MHACMHTYTHKCMHTYLHACIYIHACTHIYIHAYYIHAYLHAYIHAYIKNMHTCGHTYICTNTWLRCSCFVLLAIICFRWYMPIWYKWESTLWILYHYLSLTICFKRSLCFGSECLWYTPEKYCMSDPSLTPPPLSQLSSIQTCHHRDLVSYSGNSHTANTCTEPYKDTTRQSLLVEFTTGTALPQAWVAESRQVHSNTWLHVRIS